MNKFSALMRAYVEHRRRGIERDGQALFNALTEVDPPLAERIRGDANLDPFYKDSNFAVCMEEIVSTWSKQN